MGGWVGGAIQLVWLRLRSHAGTPACSAASLCDACAAANASPAAEKRRAAGQQEDAAAAKRSSRGGTIVRASHLLVKHRDSRRPSSWKVKG